MATTIYEVVGSYESWWFFTLTGTEYDQESLYLYPYPYGVEVAAQWQNKAWDSVAGGWVFWNTDYPDVGGVQYPGPGEWGVETSEHAVQARVFGRYERV